MFGHAILIQRDQDIVWLGCAAFYRCPQRVTSLNQIPHHALLVVLQAALERVGRGVRADHRFSDVRECHRRMPYVPSV